MISSIAAGRSRAWRALCGLALGALATQPALADYRGEAVDQFVAEMTRDHGFAEEQLQQLFSQVERKQPILDAISRPAERVKPWKEYRPIFLTQQRIDQGVDFWARHADDLARAEREYGVPAQFIVAIIGVETFYGRITGNYRVIDALSTLGFDYPPRQPFFRQQLKEYLLMTREQQLDPLSLKGSYAGAMGLPQFMPGSFRAYAVDFDGDGHINLWSNPADAIGSVASYFKAHGWRSGEAVAVRARVSGERFAEGLSSGLESERTAGELRTLGWRGEATIADDTPITAFRLEGAAGDEYWIGLPNFYVITRYNRSVMYAMAVNQLAGELVAARSAQ